MVRHLLFSVILWEIQVINRVHLRGNIFMLPNLISSIFQGYCWLVVGYYVVVAYLLVLAVPTVNQRAIFYYRQVSTGTYDVGFAACNFTSEVLCNGKPTASTFSWLGYLLDAMYVFQVVFVCTAVTYEPAHLQAVLKKLSVHLFVGFVKCNA